ncbi:MAG: hypothetical protein U9Q81_07300, partial [Pseudomonadota bacterium]|nr:hypothetical protein [Pseudomonadota bacterium]
LDQPGSILVGFGEDESLRRAQAGPGSRDAAHSAGRASRGPEALRDDPGDPSRAYDDDAFAGEHSGCGFSV